MPVYACQFDLVVPGFSHLLSEPYLLRCEFPAEIYLLSDLQLLQLNITIISYAV